MAEGTASLRLAAPRWNLAGDQQLLNILQDIHQRIVAKCNETNSRLEEMSRGLRDASVNLQNVNNKFLALSNTQFVESRVYDDDADVTAPPTVDKQTPQITDLTSDLSKLKQSLQVLESYHEPLHILRDSDSDSDSEDGDDRLVFRPKDLYAERPLPFIIGTAQWKAKWHAGLVDSESDSESGGAPEPAEEYSESDEEPAMPDPSPVRKISTGGSSIQSEAVSVSVSPVRPSPSAVAAELARRLGGGFKLPEREPVYSEPETVVRKLYKPQQPVATTIFPDEPPPLDEESSDDDIFAELHKTHPKVLSNRVESDLFDFAPKPNDLQQALFGAAQNEPTPLVSQQDESEQERNDTSILESKEKEDNIKKPIGGISLFGTNKHAESIGAAILKRNRRKSSTSGDESNTEEVNEVKTTEPKEVKKERDIFDDLFAKSEKLNKKNTNNAPVEPKEVKKDVFSDIFDDIDDIFSSDIVNVKIKETKNSEKPLFSDDDDLFAEISKTKSEKMQKVEIEEKSNLIDHVKPKIEKPVVDTKINAIKEIKKESKGLFDSDSDDGLFTKAKDIPKENIQKLQEPVDYKINDNVFGDEDVDDDLFTKNKPTVKEVKDISKATKNNAFFDSDDDLFVNNGKQNLTQEKEKQNVVLSKDDDNLCAPAPKLTAIDSTDKSNAVDNSKENLFKSKEKSGALKVVENINNDIFNDGDELYKKAESSKPNDKTMYGNFGNEELFTSNKSINAVKTTESKSEDKPKVVGKSINDDIFNDSDELFKRTESSKEYNAKISEDNLDDKESFTRNKSIINKSQTVAARNEDTQSSRNDFASNTNNDFYNQPYEQIGNILRTTRIASDEENIQTDKTKQDACNDSDEELFKSAPMPNYKDSNDSQNKITSSTAQVTKETFTAKTVDVFSDIFDDVPPIFEKPKESKKSRNVNALFDDDSDDEALFFKKNDAITDEKPDFSPSDERFGIFNDEPPAIDVDFTQNSSINHDISQKTYINVDPAEEISATEDSSIVPNKIENIPPKTNKLDDETVTKNSVDTTDNTVKEPKKVGKLKPMNFNINVNTLLPGASPKKKQIEDIDPHSASNEELHKTDKIEPAVVKSISFDDPEILDNKLSKGRAKIQVKRRPSTRRARKEAVRKSAIDLTDSSFDSSNDSSVKDNVKEKVVKTVYILNDADIFGDKVEKPEPVLETTKKHLNIVDSDEELFKSSNNSKTVDTEIKNNNLQDNNEKKSFLDSDDDLFKNKNSQIKREKDENESKSFLDSDDGEDLFKQIKLTSSNIVQTNIHKSTTISQDTLLIKTENKNFAIEKINESKSFLDSDDNDDLFTSKTTRATTVSKSNYSSDEDLFRKQKGIETLGKAYESKDTKVNVGNMEKKPHNIFDDFPPTPKETITEDEKIKPKEVIKEKAPTIEKPVVKKSILDDSSDEDDLFKTRTKLPVNKEGKSLFGDDLGDGEDLFGPKPVKELKPNAPAPQTKELKSAETVFVDPLSLFGDDE